MESKKVSNNMLARMPIYLNYIKALPETTKNISATKIANALGLGEVSVRKDLAKVSDGGRCKLGYPCDELINDIESFLGVKKALKAVVVGKGEMLQVLLNYGGFENAGLNVVAAFDISLDKNRSVKEQKVFGIQKLEEICEENNVSIGIIMTAADDAQEICDLLISKGIEGIWNFTPVHLSVPEHVVLQNESFTASITKFRMQLKERSEAS